MGGTSHARKSRKVGVQRADLSPPFHHPGSQDLGHESLRFSGTRAAELGQGCDRGLGEKTEGQRENQGVEGEGWQAQVAHNGVYQTLNLCR